MSKSSLHESTCDSAVPPAPPSSAIPGSAGFFSNSASSDSRTALDRLIPLLQDCTDAVMADAGIARFSIAALDVISSLAQHEAETACERAHLLLRLLEHGLETPSAFEQSDLVRTAQHAQRLLYDQQRWRDLADNAVYYRDHREVARRITTLRQSASAASGGAA